MPVVTVTWFAGRDAARKRRVAQGIMAVLAGEGVDPAGTSILFQDIAREDWLLGEEVARMAPGPRTDDG